MKPNNLIYSFPHPSLTPSPSPKGEGSITGLRGSFPSAGRLLMGLLFALFFTINASAQEAYAVYTEDNTTLTFYYDTQRSSRTGTTYGLNTGNSSPGWSANRASVTSVVFDSSFANARPTSTYYWFSQMNNLTNITGMEYLNTSEVTNMSYMFYYCNALTALDLSSFNTANVTDMNNMFFLCSVLTSLNLSSFDTHNVTNMSKMFSHCEALTSLDLSNFNTAKVTNMNGMFEYTNLTTLNISSFDTSIVTDMGSMFDSCNQLDAFDLSNFNTAKVTNMSSMFRQCKIQYLDLSSFNTVNVTNMTYMFSSCSSLKSIYVGDNWNTDAVTSSGSMFSSCYSLFGGAGTIFNSQILLRHTPSMIPIIRR